MADDDPFNTTPTAAAVTEPDTIDSVVGLEQATPAGRSNDVAEERSAWKDAIIENEGSTARDFLARERNFLQYMKLSATMLTVGVAMVMRLRFSTSSEASPDAEKPDPYTYWLGVVFMIFSLLTVSISVHEFFVMSTAMRRHLGFVSSGRISQIFWALLVVATFTGTILIFVHGKRL